MGCKTTLWILALLAAIGSTTACSEHPDAPSLPRQWAWPRIDVDTAMVKVDNAPVPFYAAVDARLTTKHGDVFGLDIDYPQYGATVYVSFIPVNDTSYPQVLAARLERIRLNLNGAPADRLTTDSSLLVTTTTSAQIPVQLLARRDGYLVSATAAMHDDAKHANYDSIRPVYEAISYHLKNAIK